MTSVSNRMALAGSGRPGSLLTLAPHRSGRAGSAASGSSTDSFATRRRVPAGPGSQAMATAIPKACLASSAIRCRDVETGPTLGVLAVFPSTGATCRCPPSLHGVSWAQFPRFGGTLRHSDSSPSIPPRFVAFARRYHPSTCSSLRRTPGAPSTASGLVSRCPRPGGLYDGDDEASRVPGKPTRTHATRSDPGEVAASTASETRRDDLPSNARRRPSHSMHVGAQSRGLRAPCERFAPGVTPGPRITRFRLAADLGRMGLDTHRVSNKVSKITSRHLVPLDRAFPAHALVHGSELRDRSPVPREGVTPLGNCRACRAGSSC